jgi:hypothetical protein
LQLILPEIARESICTKLQRNGMKNLSDTWMLVMKRATWNGRKRLKIHEQDGSFCDESRYYWLEDDPNPNPKLGGTPKQQRTLQRGKELRCWTNYNKSRGEVQWTVQSSVKCENNKEKKTKSRRRETRKNTISRISKFAKWKK